MLSKLDVSTLKKNLKSQENLTPEAIEDIIVEHLPGALFELEELKEVDEESVHDCVLEIASSVREDIVEMQGEKLGVILKQIEKETCRGLLQILGIDIREEGFEEEDDEEDEGDDEDDEKLVSFSEDEDIEEMWN